MSHWFTVAAITTLYLLPSIIAFYRGHASKWGILILNVIGGFTVVLWCIALIWAFSNRGASQTIIVNNHLAR